MHQPRNWFSSVQDNTLRKMKRLGFSPAEIGEKLGRTEYTVRERARTMGIPWQKDPGSSVLVNSTPTGLDKDRDAEARQRAADERFVNALLEAFERGEFPGQKKPEPEPVRTRPVPAKRPSLFSVWED